MSAEDLERARAFVARGWRVLPVEYGGKRPVPGIAWGTVTASDLPDKTLAYYFGREPVNIGIGAKGSGLVIIDEDREGAFAKLAGDYGHEVPQTYRVRTAKGWHYYFTAPEGYSIGNRPGVLADYGIDVRGGGDGDGGYVVAAGSRHESGITYTEDDPDADEILLPWWLVELLTVPAESPGETSGDDAGLFDRDPYPRGQAKRMVGDLVALLRATEPPSPTRVGKGRNERLNDAAIMAGHFVPGHWSREGAAATLEAEGRRCGLEFGEVADTVASGLDAGMLDPWPAMTEEQEAAAAAEDDELERAVRRKRIDRQASRIVSAEEREPLRVLAGAEFLAGEDLEFLVRGMFYRSSTAKVFGPPGGAKTFLLLDIALCLATGRPWRGLTLGRHRVHFVMAEGEAVNRLRVRAWLIHHEVAETELNGWFTAIPQGVLLTPEGIPDYLEVVAADRPALVVLDTKNAMMDGDENLASDAAVMIRAMRAIRDAGERACVVLVDHTGLGNTERGRGSNAVTAAMDTEIRVERDAAGIATATVTRDKAGEPGASWSFRLEAVEIERPAGIRAPAVVVATDAPPRDGVEPEPVVVPSDVWEFTGRGQPDIYEVAELVIGHGSGASGISRAEVIGYYRAAHPELGSEVSRKRVARAWDALHELKRLAPVSPSGTSRIAHHRWAEKADPEADQ